MNPGSTLKLMSDNRPGYRRSTLDEVRPNMLCLAQECIIVQLIFLSFPVATPFMIVWSLVSLLADFDYKLSSFKVECE